MVEKDFNGKKYSKESYNEMIKELISNLIEQKEDLVNDLVERACPIIDYRETSYLLSQSDIMAINDLRVRIATIYKLIDDLQELNK